MSRERGQHAFACKSFNKAINGYIMTLSGIYEHLLLLKLALSSDITRNCDVLLDVKKMDEITNFEI